MLGFSFVSPGAALRFGPSTTKTDMDFPSSTRIRFPAENQLLRVEPKTSSICGKIDQGDPYWPM